MENAMELIRARHSVRGYLDKKIPEYIREKLDAFAAELNGQSGLHIQILYDEPACFSSRMAKYGRFENCANYIAMVGRKAPDLEERCGYYGEKLVLKAQELGLNTCWAALTHGKSVAQVADGETEVILIALGYGKTQGANRRSKKPADVSNGAQTEEARSPPTSAMSPTQAPTGSKGGSRRRCWPPPRSTSRSFILP